ncbi:Anaerobic selenocysteine-containing dehydrogenase [Anaeromicropila populeti]|uniref:Anaerobic selenocysteine-containing dehydrogenase n=2 Tax=Anaeromicropila populeti TaxID=37658 RepID=A0A1I6HT38_9FIRM|nr:Anaerobic selenocysteine-containing dehydrogenase [Anaeromicropila populeti]
MENYVDKYGMIIDLDKCIGCYTCQVSCQKEHNLPRKAGRIKLHIQDIGSYPNQKRIFFPALCNHCEMPICTKCCSSNALYLTEQGVVLYDEEKCAYCFSCLKVCTSGAIRYQKEFNLLNKCDFCWEQLQQGLQPACVQNCMGKALHFGVLNHEESEIVQMLKENQNYLYVQKTLTSSLPKVFYIQRGKNHFESLTSIDLSLYNFQFPRSELVQRKPISKQTYINTVDLMCPAECSIRVLVEDGQAKKICGNPKSFNNQGTICAKGAAGLELVYSPQRIKVPLVRVGERGSGRWKEVSWNYALDEISKKLLNIKKRYGAESVILDCGDLTDTEPYMMLFHAFGTPNTFTHSAICDTNRRWGSKLMMGDERPLPDIQRPVLLRNSSNEMYQKQEHDIKLLINVGANPLVATRFHYMSRGIPEAQVNNQMYYVVIDPAFTNSAAKADMWLPVTPGTDAELLACMLSYIITHDNRENKNASYIDHNFIENYTEGWGEFKQEFLNQSRMKDETNGFLYFSPEWGEEKTGIEQSKIIQLAHLMGITKPAAIEMGMHGGAHHLAGDVTSVLANVICAVTGNIDVPGGLVFSGAVKPILNLPSRRINGSSTTFRIVNGEKRYGNYLQLHKDLYGDFPLAWRGTVSTIPSNIRNGITLKKGSFRGHTYPIKAFINRTGNPLYTGGNTNEWIDAFQAEQNGEKLLELIVHIDTHMNETGRYADFILPECSYLEKMGLSDQYTINPEIALRDRVIAPQYESKTPFWIMQNLASALVEAGDEEIAHNKLNCYQSEEDLLNTQLRSCPGLRNIGQPLPYAQYPEGALIEGIPDNPNVYVEGELIHKGESLTVSWLRENDGVAAWPVSYYRYRSSNGGTPSGYLPMTGSGKFQFNFRYKVESSDKAGCYKTTAFMWKENNSQFTEEIKKQYPFYLITGRTHQTGTMTQVCSSLADLETEANRKLNDVLVQAKCDKNTIAIPVFLLNETEGNEMGIHTGDKIRLENANGTHLIGKAFLSNAIKAGVIKTTFGSGGRKVSAKAFVEAASYTPNVNRMYDSSKMNKITGMPSFGDIMVRVVKEEEREDERCGQKRNHQNQECQ